MPISTIFVNSSLESVERTLNRWNVRIQQNQDEDDWLNLEAYPEYNDKDLRVWGVSECAVIAFRQSPNLTEITLSPVKRNPDDNRAVSSWNQIGQLFDQAKLLTIPFALLSYNLQPDFSFLFGHRPELPNKSERESELRAAINRSPNWSNDTNGQVIYLDEYIEHHWQELEKETEKEQEEWDERALLISLTTREATGRSLKKVLGVLGTDSELESRTIQVGIAQTTPENLLLLLTDYKNVHEPEWTQIIGAINHGVQLDARQNPTYIVFTPRIPRADGMIESNVAARVNYLPTVTNKIVISIDVLDVGWIEFMTRLAGWLRETLEVQQDERNNQVTLQPPAMDFAANQRKVPKVPRVTNKRDRDANRSSLASIKQGLDALLKEKKTLERLADEGIAPSPRTFRKHALKVIEDYDEPTRMRLQEILSSLGEWKNLERHAS